MSAELIQENSEVLHLLGKIEAIIRHIDAVKENAVILGKRLIQKGDADLGKRLIAHSYTHDNSKFYGIEWDYLGAEAGKSKLELAVQQHNTSPANLHHPEAWGESGITEMPRVFLAELVCDWKARSTEFGTSLREWVDDGAMKRFGYKKNDKTYKEIMFFVDLLCDKPFKQSK